MQKSILWHENGGNHDKVTSQKPYFRCCVIHPRKQWRQKQHHQSHAGTAEDGKCNHFVIRISGFLHFAGTQKLSHNDSNGITQSNKHNIKYIIDGIGNIQSGNYIQSADRIALCQHCHTGCPECLVK